MQNCTNVKIKFFSASHIAVKLLFYAYLCLAQNTPAWADITQQNALCLDGFCIGQSIKDSQFDKTAWIIPINNYRHEQCKRVGCMPENAFRGYSTEEQIELSAAVSYIYGSIYRYSIISQLNLAALRKYKYECDLSAGSSINDERRFLGIYRSTPNNYVTIVGLRLIDGDLKVYRLAREYPYHNNDEIRLLGQKIHQAYGDDVLLYNGISSNAYSDVIKQEKLGWFAHSQMFNPSDLSDNKAELVLIDPQTRQLLNPTSMPESGDIQPQPPKLPLQCARSMTLQ